LKSIAEVKGVPLTVIGKVGGNSLKIRFTAHGSRFTAVDLPIADLENQWRNAIKKQVEDV